MNVVRHQRPPKWPRNPHALWQPALDLLVYTVIPGAASLETLEATGLDDVSSVAELAELPPASVVATVDADMNRDGRRERFAGGRPDGCDQLARRRIRGGGGGAGRQWRTRGAGEGRSCPLTVISNRARAVTSVVQPGFGYTHPPTPYS